MTRPFKIALALLALVVFAIAVETHSAELTKLQARDILYVAYGQFHGPRALIEYPPRIHISPAATLREKFQSSCSAHCPPILGLYDEGSGEIYLLDTLDFATVYATTVLLHEYIHYFQGKTRGRVMDLQLDAGQRCLEIVEREREAYRIQYDVLLKAGDFLHAQSVRIVAGMLHCS